MSLNEAALKEADSYWAQPQVPMPAPFYAVPTPTDNSLYMQVAEKLVQLNLQEGQTGNLQKASGGGSEMCSSGYASMGVPTPEVTPPLARKTYSPQAQQVCKQTSNGDWGGPMPMQTSALQRQPSKMWKANIGGQEIMVDYDLFKQDPHRYIRQNLTEEEDRLLDQVTADELMLGGAGRGKKVGGENPLLLAWKKTQAERKLAQKNKTRRQKRRNYYGQGPGQEQHRPLVDQHREPLMDNHNQSLTSAAQFMPPAYGCPPQFLPAAFTNSEQAHIMYQQWMQYQYYTRTYGPQFYPYPQQ